MEDESTLDPSILGYYNQGRERDRLETWCQVEFVRTQELLARFLPPPPATVLDVGGGAGIHAKPLLDAGYDVTLVDPVALHIEQAHADGIAKAELGDARSLRFGDEAFDAVLLLGPLYHLIDRDDRVQALSEARRVAGPDGVVLAAVISRFASTYDGLLHAYLLDREFEQIVEGDLASGVHRNQNATPGWFTTAYFHDPDELRDEFLRAGCLVGEILAIEGPAAQLPDADEWLGDPERREVLLRAIRRVETEPSIMGASGHILVVSDRGSG